MNECREASDRTGRAGRRRLTPWVRPSVQTIPGYSETIAPDRLMPGRGRPGFEDSPKAVGSRSCTHGRRDGRSSPSVEPARGRRAVIGRVF
jgi:hypothetical protein